MTPRHDATAAASGGAASETLAYAPIHVLADGLRAGTLSASALLECYLERIGRLDGKLHAFIALYEAEARAAAAIADQAFKSGQRIGPLHGIPIALKDLVEIEDHTTTGG